MDSKTIQTKHSSLDDPLSVHPWSNLLQKLHDDIDDETLDRLIFLSRAQLSKRQLGEISGEGKFHKWITALEGTLGDSDVVTFIIKLLKCEQLHSSQGDESWADLVNQYRLEKEQFLQKCAERGLCQDANFTGRNTLIQEIIDTLTSPSDSRLGVILCGQSGMGKTSVANEVCHRFMYSKEVWDVLVCNQREKSSLRELLADLISVFEPETVVDPSIGVKDLKIQLGHLISENRSTKRILLVDNLDCHCDTQNKFEALHAVITEMINCIGKSPNLKLVLTVGRKLNFEDEMPGWRNTRFGGAMLEIELRPFTDEDTAMLLKRVTKLSDEMLPSAACSRVQSLCGGNPMAIRTVASMLQYGCTVNDVITCLQHDSNIPLADGQLESCIRKSINLLANDESTDNLVQLLASLLLFQSAHFDISAAVAVGSTNMGVGQGMTFGTRHKNAYGRIEEAMMEYKLLSLKSRHLVEIDKMTRKKGKDVRHAYSLHPLIFKYLKKIVDENEALKRHCAKAKLLFMRHFYAVVQKCGRCIDTDPLKAKRIIEENEVHIREFFKLLAADVHVSELTISKDQQEHRVDIILEHKRIWKVAEFVTASNSIEQKLLAQKQAKLAKTEKELYTYIHWSCLEVDYLIMHDRWELGEKRVDHLSHELGIVMPGSEEQGEGFGCLHSPEWKENEDEKIPVVATFYVVKGMIYQKKNILDNALDSFSTAEILYKGKQKIPNVIESKIDGKRIYKKSSYTCELAQVVNRIGQVHFEKKQFDKARLFHEEALYIVESLCGEQTGFHKDSAIYITNVGTCFHQLAFAKSKADPEREIWLEKAMEMYEKSRRYNKVMKRDKLIGEANALRNLADVYFNKKDNNIQKSLRYAQQALTIFKRLVKPPNVDLTLMMSKVAYYHLKLGRKNKAEHDPEEADKHFKESLYQYDAVLMHIQNGGLPMDHNQYRTYSRIQANHMKVMGKLKYSRSLIQDRKTKYSDFERGKREKKIQEIRHQDWDYDPREWLRQLAAEGKTYTLEPCSDDDETSSDDDDSEETPSSESTERSSETSSSSSSSDEEFVAVLTRGRKDSGFDVDEDLTLGNSMEIDDMQEDVAAGHIDMQSSGTDIDQQDNDVRQGSRGDMKPQENFAEPKTFESYKTVHKKPLVRQASFDLPVIPDEDRCSGDVDVNTGVASGEIKADSFEALPVFGQASEMTDGMKLAVRENIGDVNFPMNDGGANFESQSSLKDNVGQASLEEAHSSYRSIACSRSSEQGSQISEDRRTSWRSSMSSLGSQKKLSWASGDSAGSYDDPNRASMESQDSLMLSGGASRKRKSFSNSGSQDSLSSKLSQLFLLNPKSFEEGESKASSKKKSRKDKK